MAAERFYQRHGGKTVFFGRFVPVVRSVGFIVAGVAGMEWKRFIVYDVAGAVLWGIGHSVLGTPSGPATSAGRYLADRARVPGRAPARDRGSSSPRAEGKGGVGRDRGRARDDRVEGPEDRALEHDREAPEAEASADARAAAPGEED